MGYASPTQQARGIHTRLFSRAFVFESDGERVVYVSAGMYNVDIVFISSFCMFLNSFLPIDIGMVDQAIKSEVS